MKRILLAAILLIIFGPVLIRQMTKPDERRYLGVRLSEVSFNEVSFQNTDQNLKLTGMMFVPDGAGPFPAAVFIRGSGPSSRENITYLTLAQFLIDNDIAVLLPDIRGSYQAEGAWETASLEDLATDTLAAIAYLQTQKQVPISDIGIIGFSLGGQIGPIVADHSNDVAFLVTVAGGAAPMYDLMDYQANQILLDMGFLPGISDAIAPVAAWVDVNLYRRSLWGAIGNFDVVPYWRRLSVEALAMYGENDTKVPSLESAAILRSLDKPNIDIRIYEGSEHGLQDPEGMGIDAFRQDALMDIRDFIFSASTQ